MASGSTIRAAAADAGCSESTGYRIAVTEPFRRRVAELRHAVTDRTVGLLAEGSARAVLALVELLDSDDDATKLTAAKAVLGLLSRVAEHCELRGRLDRLEFQTKATGTDWRPGNTGPRQPAGEGTTENEGAGIRVR